MQLPWFWEVWATERPIGETYLAIASTAVDEQWGLETIVVQDDVRFEFRPYESKREFVVYGQQFESGHICPRAFAATPDGWAVLQTLWSDAPKSACPGFRAAVDGLGGVILNTSTHLWGRRDVNAST